MKLLKRLHKFLFGDIAEEYFERFVKPQIERAKERGIPPEELDRMWELALKEANPTVLGLAPASILRDLIDAWEPTEPK